MANPKVKTSKSRRNHRRSHHHATTLASGTCGNCGEIKQSHIVCPSCGFYKKRQVVETDEL